MFEQPRWSKWAVLSLVAGYVWISAAASLPLLAGVLPWIVGALLLAAGVSQLIWPGDPKINETAALAGFVGVLLSVPYGLALGFGEFVLLALSGAGAAWGAGWLAIQLEPHHENVPVPEPSALLAAKVAIDDVILGTEQWLSTPIPLDGTQVRVIDELERADAFLRRAGVEDKPELYHRAPPELLDPEIRWRRAGRQSFEVLRFESGYGPAEGEPGRERWLGYDACRDAWAYVMRHPGEPRPWLVATNGFRMGMARIDVPLFARFHRRLGLNVLIPVLPLHGPRRRGWHSGSGFLGVDLVDTLHAEAQAIWDMRRLLSWIRAQGAPAVGAFGLSLGGYTTAVFASLVEGLSCAIAGIPLSDVPRALERHGAIHQTRYMIYRGLDFERAERVLAPVSPLALHPKVPRDGRLIFGAIADRLVTPDQVRDLWRHWEEPEIVWYQGAHLSFQREEAVWNAVDRKLRETGLCIESS